MTAPGSSGGRDRDHRRPAISPSTGIPTAQDIVAAARGRSRKANDDSANQAPDLLMRELVARRDARDRLFPIELRERRARFLALVSELAPEVLESLRSTVLPDYSVGDDQLRMRILAWARTRGIGVSWVIDAAESTLYAMREDPTVRFFAKRVGIIPKAPGGPFHTGTIPYGALRSFFPSATVLPLILDLAGWDRANESKEEAKARMQDDAANSIAYYLEQVELAAAQLGSPPVHDKYGSDKDRHLRWLVRWQVQKWTKPAIIQQEHVDKTTLNEGLENAARDVGLPLRKGAPGRPLKNR